MISQPSPWLEIPLDAEPEPAQFISVSYWQSWRFPLLLAVLVHAAIGLLLVQHSWQRPVTTLESPRAIEAYFYQPPVVAVAEPAISHDEPEPATPEELAAALQVVEEAAAMPPLPNETAADAGVSTAEVPEPSLETAQGNQAVGRAFAQSRGSLMDRALQQLQNTDDLASAHRAQQIQRHAQPSITVEKRYQEIQDGSQPIRNARGCLTSDPSKDGFDALMAAKYVPCGDEISAAQQLQEILQRRSRHSGRSN
ncbi:hypothetical protein ABC502_11530 [Alkalimonas sp. NCh-2]|uniref:hypothetical protein n=1 Tax=Alkalimonas sp. NCh-2 TaxID=3144846 RepID=UPI0031F67E5B